MDFTNKMDSYLDKLKMVIDCLSREEINCFVKHLLDAYNNSSNIIIFGNGGSALTASHFACDFNKGVSYGLEKRFRVICLSDNISTIMAYSNDVDYDSIFVEQLKNILNDNDLVIGISGSGNSVNVLRAIEYANHKRNTTFGITGYNGGKLKLLAKYSVNANIDDMQLSEDIHMILVHLVMRIIYGELH